MPLRRHVYRISLFDWIPSLVKYLPEHTSTRVDYDRPNLSTMPVKSDTNGRHVLCPKCQLTTTTRPHSLAKVFIYVRYRNDIFLFIFPKLLCGWGGGGGGGAARAVIPPAPRSLHKAKAEIRFVQTSIFGNSRYPKGVSFSWSNTTFLPNFLNQFSFPLRLEIRDFTIVDEFRFAC